MASGHDERSERLEQFGERALSDAELVPVLLGPTWGRTVSATRRGASSLRPSSADVRSAGPLPIPADPRQDLGDVVPQRPDRTPPPRDDLLLLGCEEIAQSFRLLVR
jgi:hypothetical protein